MRFKTNGVGSSISKLEGHLIAPRRSRQAGIASAAASAYRVQKGVCLCLPPIALAPVGCANLQLYGIS